VQRLFSGFPSGPPGAGLLLLRAVVSLHLGSQCVGAILARPSGEEYLTLGMIAVCGAFLIVAALTLCGLHSPATQVLTIVTQLALLSGLVPFAVATDALAITVIAIAVSLILLGPGAYSIDSFIFGRREIIIPPVNRDNRVF
jgi:hypothetical protein